MTKRDDYVCLRCLRDDETIEISGPDKAIKECARCGVENWCLPVKRAKTAAEATKEKVAESIPTEVPDLILPEESEPSEALDAKAAEIAEIEAKLAELKK